MGVGQRALSLSPPTPGPGEGGVSSPYPRSIAYTTVTSLLRGTGGFHHPRERASTPPFTQEVLVAGTLSAAAFAGGVGGMELGAWRWRRTCRSRLWIRHSAATPTWGRISYAPWIWLRCYVKFRLFLRPGTGPYGRLAWPWSSTSLLLRQRATQYAFRCLTLREFLSRSTAAAGNYAFAWIRTSGVTSPRRPEAFFSSDVKTACFYRAVGYAPGTPGLGLAQILFSAWIADGRLNYVLTYLRHPFPLPTGIISVILTVIHRHRHRHRPSPVQVEHLSFSFMWLDTSLAQNYFSFLLLIVQSWSMWYFVFLCYVYVCAADSVPSLSRSNLYIWLA